MLDIIERAVEEEVYLWNDAQLLGHLVTELAADGLHVIVEHLHHSLRLVGREYADEGLGEGKVGADPDLADRYHSPRERSHPLPTDDFRKVALKFAGDFELSCRCWFLHLLYLDDVIVLLAFLGEDVLAVDDVSFSKLVVRIVPLLLVDREAVALDHLAGLGL